MTISNKKRSRPLSKLFPTLLPNPGYRKLSGRVVQTGLAGGGRSSTPDTLSHRASWHFPAQLSMKKATPRRTILVGVARRFAMWDGLLPLPEKSLRQVDGNQQLHGLHLAIAASSAKRMG